MSPTPAKIYRPAKTAMQSGKAKTQQWILEFERPAPGDPDALMGWNTQPNTITQVKLFFETREEAIAYAEIKSLPFTVIEPKSSAIPPKTYAENFSYIRRNSFDGDC